ncbi:MAG: HAMP domain-containing sensor histidine kinase [Lactobacillus sp.]|nr:HAMP domain-containing sensor histidine kinase [Lactobacillus sp.]
MKLIYQYLMAFMVIIGIIIAIVGYSEVNFAIRHSYGTNYTRMENYAEQIAKMASKKGKNGLNPGFLDSFQYVNSKDDLRICLINKKGEQVYPGSFMSIQLKQNILKQLKKGDLIKVANSQLDPQFKNEDKLAYSGIVYPIFKNSKFNGAIWISTQVAIVEKPIKQAKQNLFQGFLLGTLVSALLSILMAYIQTNKIKRLLVATQKVAKGDYSVQISHKSVDEIDSLAISFNKMVRSLKRTSEEAEEQIEMRERFLADAAHEMRTPLTTINGLLEGMAYGVIEKEDQKKSIELMQHETKRLIRLVNDNVDYEKIRTNKVVLVESDFDGSQLLQNIVSQLANNAHKKGNELFLHVPKKMPIYGDPDRVTQIFVNVIQNAIQFTENGKITVSGKRLEHETVISIKDTGIGMTKEQMKFIFERFFKADPARAKRGSGESGLGLSIVSSLVKQHGGEITVDSTPGKGSTFVITFYDKGYQKDQAD